MGGDLISVADWVVVALIALLVLSAYFVRRKPRSGTRSANPNNAAAHANLGDALLGPGLKKKGDVDGAIAEYREALRLNPNDDDPHVNLGLALAKKKDSKGAMAEAH
jgi:Flp pilus assembly protein TadD